MLSSLRSRPSWRCLNHVQKRGHTQIPTNSSGITVELAADKEPTGPVRVRFAPSPTGMLHLGGLRTALFNYLLARRYGGSFILRIEDTDQKRLVAGATENIIQTLKWAGLSFDEGPGKVGGGSESYFQSQRGDVYRKHAAELLKTGAAYRCFCGPQRLESLRADSVSQGTTPMYDRHCVHLSQRQIDEKLRLGEPFTTRLLAPNPADPKTAAEVSRFNDIVHGCMHFRGPAGFDDAVLLKSDGLPTYHLANVVDDHLMGITHVLRGEEWLISTPKHRALFRAFGWPIPQYAHLPLLMNIDGSKLSKRNRDGPVQRYIEDGYLPSALVNYTAQLGWHPEGSQEVLSLAELERTFSLGGLGRSKSTVSRERLDWLNRQHIRLEISDPQRSYALAQQAQAELPQDFRSEAASGGIEAVRRALVLASDRLTFTKDLYSTVPFLFSDPDLDTPAAVKLLHKVPEDCRSTILQAAVVILQVRIRSAVDNSERWAEFAKGVASSAQVPVKHAMMMLRYALTGQHTGPQIHALMETLPTESIERRLLNALSISDSRPHTTDQSTSRLPS
ncbi:Glutamate--tRNA ligase mitochondrial [Coemansia sp. RSA 988]|nr:Glutamate--tRNA ligase mitochondrial [Coemansia sp. RSA 988]